MKLLLVSLGCDKNLCDSEEMLGLLSSKGIQITDDETEADVIIINTCAFINDAKEESINTIIELAGCKISAGNGGKCRALIVTGCLAERYADEIKKELPEVDAVVGTTAYDDISEVIDKCLNGIKVYDLKDINILPSRSPKRIVTTGGHYAYLKIAEGCNKRCSYCIIPSLRGRYRSYPMDDLITNAKLLSDNGVKELILVAQETTLYGSDLYGKKALPELLSKLSKIEGLEWIRIMYAYPEEITDELIEVMASEKKICHYIDMPIQHASDKILRRMGRKTDRESLSRLIEKLRGNIPDIAIRTTLLSGFPGETKEDHIELYNFVDETEFDRLGVFSFSPEEGTAAYDMPDQIPDEIKKERYDELMLLQQEIAFEKAREKNGKDYKVFIEGRLVDENVYVARTYMDAPGIDGNVFVGTDRDLMSGDFYDVHITGAHEYDLIGGLKDESAE
ncbi:MAG: 30S ribosomal protein S12 methylthiotransferase RimO [Lachnospiraceae bacterium]|nr:30S ribosomal protein S12 methylthiotransferase RimO [Lachnospiraceae bacterium]